jgi:LPS export ABC transporter protein LptC
MTSGLSNGNLIEHPFLNFSIPLATKTFGMDKLLLCCLLFVLAACNNADLKEPVEYTGPLKKAENIELFYTEKDRVKVKMVAPELHEFQNGDREFPKGIELEFYNELGKMESTLRANHAFFFKKDNLWRGRGKVEVKNLATNEQLNTEELFWKQTEKRIYTDKFVTIRQQGDVVYGEGLQAKEDMSDYVILKPRGTFEIKEE